MPGRHREGVALYFHSCLTSALDRGESSTSRPGRFTPGKKTPLPIKLEAGKLDTNNKNIKWDITTVQTLTDLQNFKLRNFRLRQL